MNETIEYNGQPVLITEQLAEEFEVTTNSLILNFRRRPKDFTKDIHYFALEGTIKTEFLDQHQIDLGSKHAKTLYLWTYKGIAKHAHFVDTPRAWAYIDELLGQLAQTHPDTEATVTLQEQNAALQAALTEANSSRITSESRFQDALQLAINNMTVSHLDDKTVRYEEMEDILILIDRTHKELENLQKEHRNAKEVLAATKRLEKLFTGIQALIEHTQTKLDETDSLFLTQDSVKELATDYLAEMKTQTAYLETLANQTAQIAQPIGIKHLPSPEPSAI